MRSTRILGLLTAVLASVLFVNSATACPISKLFHPHSDDSTTSAPAK